MHVFSSPRFPMSYLNNLNCTWTLTAEANAQIALEFRSFEIESGYDFVTVGQFRCIVAFTNVAFTNQDYLEHMWLQVKKVYLVSWAVKMPGGPKRIANGVVRIEARKVVHFHHLLIRFQFYLNLWQNKLMIFIFF